MPSAVFSRRVERPAEGELDAALGIGFAERVAHILVEAAQELVAAVQQRDLAAEPGEDAGELDGDIAAADHQDALRQALEMEDLVRGDAELAAGNRRLQGRMGAHRHEDVAGADAGSPVFSEADRMRRPR